MICGRPAGWTDGPPTGFRTASVGTRCTGCWTGNGPRSWSCSRHGGRSTGPTASWPTAARGWIWCTSRSPACAGFWPSKALSCTGIRGASRPRASRGRTGWSGSRTGSGATTSPTSLAPGGSRSRSWTSSPASGSPAWCPRRRPPPRSRSPSPPPCRPRACWRPPTAGPLPLLLAISDNGPQMRSHSTREFLAGVAIAQQFGRPHTPTDQAWIETLFGHVKGEWPHLEKIRDPGALEPELDRVRFEYNGVRLHAGVGYVTPNDEHEGRGEAIRQARRDGMARAQLARIAYRRTNTRNQP